MNDYLKIAKKITSYFFNYQVISKDLCLEFIPNLDGGNKKIVGGLSFKILFFRLDKKQNQFYVFLKKEGENYSVFIGPSKNIDEATGPLKKNDFFKLYYRSVFSKYSKVKWSNKNEESKSYNFKKVGLNILKKVMKLPREIIQDDSFENYIQYAKGVLKRKQNSGKGLSKFPGIHWKIEELTASNIKLTCYDKGGIFDLYLNDELNYFPPQVPSSYYADAYSAFCFFEFFRLTKNKKYLDATINVLDFIKRTYHENNPSFFMWYHYDFKNPPIIETVYNIKPYISKDKYEGYVDFIKRLKENLYCPTNVFALRLHWRSLRSNLYGTEEDNKLKKIIKRIKKDQTDEGLILDNNLGAGYLDANDLTYHLYSLACILLGLKENKNKELLEIFLKGSDFSLNLVTSAGEVSYVGRAANNIYHYASAILVFEFCSEYYKVKDKVKSDRFKECANNIFKYLIRWQKKGGVFPTCMNNQFDKRMGWNHCESPYNLLVAYFLIKASKIIKKKIIKTKKPNISKSVKEDKFFVMPNSGYSYFENDNYYCSFYAGGGRSYFWSGHRTGLPGIANLGIINQKPLFPIIDENISCVGSSTSDLPLIIVNGIPSSFYGLNNIKKISEKVLQFKKEFEHYTYFRYLIFLKRNIISLTIIKFKKSCSFNIKGLITLPTWGGSENNISKKNKGWLLKNKNIKKIKFELIYSNFKVNSSFSEGGERTNPRGLANVFYFGEFLKKEVKKGELFIFASDITFNKKEPFSIMGKDREIFLWNKNDKFKIVV